MKLKMLTLSIALCFSHTAFADSIQQPAISIKVLGKHQAALGENASINVIGQHQTGVFAESASEIVAHDAINQRIFKVNANAASVEVLDIKDPSNPTLIGTINATALGGIANSVAVHDGVVAVAVEAYTKQDLGTVAFYNTKDLTLINSVVVGALPDMIKFTPNGQYLLVANEGEPSSDYTVDPDGSVSVIDLRKGVLNAVVNTADFLRFNGKENELRAKGIRIFGPNATTSQDLEPEYIAISKDSKYAWVSLQEANAIATIDIKKAKITKIQSLGTKDHMLEFAALDASDKDGGIHIKNWPVKGMYMPDSIDSYTYKGRSYLVTANEGDSRDYAGYSEEARVKDLKLDPTVFPNAVDLQKNENLGRLKTTIANGDIDGDGDFDEIYSYGTRSFSIWDESGLVFDSGADFEKITAYVNPKNFNSTNEENDSFDNRSDDKGPEPEGITIGNIKGHQYAFIGLERVGGIMVYDITNPYKVKFVEYINNRNFTVVAELDDGSTNPAVGDLGPEGLEFIPANKSPNKKPLLVVGNEVSGTTTIYEINAD
jgi:2',3'-cyclic-nucleotide 2'-phosphodiesterase / 3'-nucleotidase / 5'-nucleotidase